MKELLHVKVSPVDDKKEEVEHLNRSPGDDIKVKTNMYLETLSRETFAGLMSVFRHDFEMFNYDPYEHLNRTRETFGRFKINV